MKQTGILNFLFFSRIAASLLLIVLSYCFISEVRGKKNVVDENVDYQLVPICEPSISKILAKESAIKTQKFLEFFKALSKQLMPLGFYAMKSDMQDVKKLESFRRRGIVLFHKYHSEQTIKDAIDDLNAANKAGVAVLQNLPSKYLKIKGKEFWRQHISALAENKQILVWYLPEETKWDDLKYLETLNFYFRLFS